MTAEQFGERLRLLRAAKGISQKEMSQAVPVSEETISGWEKGRNLPRLDTAAIVADYFGVSLDYLAGRATIYPGAAKKQ